MIPKYLFHYTSIEGVKAILKSHNIRFNRLDRLNDPYEGDFALPEISASQKEKRKLIYCSCWNAEEDESLNLWHIYTNMRGVRIKMKSSMFSKNMVLEEQPSGFIPVSGIDPVSIQCDTFNDPIKRVYGPFNVIYVNSFKDTYDTAIGKSVAHSGTDREFDMHDVNLRELGIKKVQHWEYEHEWRYKISPYERLRGSKTAMEISYDINTPEYIDIPYTEEIEELLLAPLASEKEAELRQFLRDNNIDIPVKQSCIRYKDTKKSS